MAVAAPLALSFAAVAKAETAPVAPASHAVVLDKPFLPGQKPVLTASAIGPVVRADMLGGVSALTAFNPVSFGAPWMLLGLGALPLLWYMFRRTPPVPKSIPFPPLKMMFGLRSKDEKPASMPIMHRLLRLAAATAVIAAVAQPKLNPEQPITGDGPILLVVDNDWAAARHWPARLESMRNLLNHAGERPVLILNTAAPQDGGNIRVSEPLSADAAKQLLEKMEPMPWLSDDKAALAALSSAQLQGKPSVVWMSDGLQNEGALELATKLQEMGALTVIQDPAKDTARMVAPSERTKDNLVVTVTRADGALEDSMDLTATDEQGRALGVSQAHFAAGEVTAKVKFSLPDELLDKVMQVTINGENSAGATALMDERWRRRPVGMIEDGVSEPSELLLSGSNYVKQALDPYVDLRTGKVDDLLKRDMSVMVMTDNATVNDPTRAKIDEWINKGGTLLRFAGPRLAGHPDDSLLPVPLRDRERILGGAPGSPQSWNKAETLMPFASTSPFYGIQIPKDLQITRQVLAQPVPDLASRTWAALEDGSPLVTAEKHGKGWIVLIHTTANPEWSNLSLNGGLFIDMLRAIVAQSQASNDGPNTGAAMPAWKTLDGEGRLGNPPAAARPLSGAVTAKMLGPQLPPGFYGTQETRRAVNLGTVVQNLKALGDLPEGIKREVYATSKENDLTGILLAGAMALMFLDLGLALKYNGTAQRKKPSAPPAPAVA